jgi:hypothetical protein
VRVQSKQNKTARERASVEGSAEIGLVKKIDVARATCLSLRSVDKLIRGRRIPVVRLSNRCVRFHLPSVLAALRRHEVKAVASPLRSEGGVL